MTTSSQSIITCLLHRNGKQTGEVVDSYTSKKFAAASAKAPAEEEQKEAKKGPNKVLSENNAAAAKPANSVTEQSPRRKVSRQQKPATIKVRLGYFHMAFWPSPTLALRFDLARTGSSSMCVCILSIIMTLTVLSAGS